jgi:hypothetical protein
MSCIIIQNLINCIDDIELVGKFGDYKMINFILIHTKFQVYRFG